MLKVKELELDFFQLLYALMAVTYVVVIVIPFTQILESIAKIGCLRVTLTGGEPLFRAGMNDLIEALSWGGYHVNIETNGSVPIEPCCSLPGVFVTMDWKCPSSGMLGSMLESNLKKLTYNDVLKFVVATKEDLEEFKRIYNMDLTVQTMYSHPVHKSSQMS